jgi:DNA mismatch endonuclease (patch repair protein)
MKANSAVETSPEVTLRKALWKAGVRGYRKNDGRIFGRPDLYFARARLCVFIHGCFWHGCLRCKRNLKPKQNSAFWEAKVCRNQARDALVTQTLAADNFRVAVYWECDVRTHLDEVVRDIVLLLTGIRTDPLFGQDDN